MYYNVLQDDWRCEKCTKRNRPTRAWCKACSSVRPESYQIPRDYLDNLSVEETYRMELDRIFENDSNRMGVSIDL